MKKNYRLPSVIFACIVGIAVGVLCMVCVYAIKFGGFSSYHYARKFSNVYNAIDRDYVGDADMENVSNAAYGAMVDAIGDRWSMYLNEKDYALYKQYSKNSYSGIGVTIEKDMDSNLYKVASVLEDSPASRAGVQTGETLLSIGKTALKGKTATQIHSLIAAQKGSFTLGLLGTDGKERSVTVSTAVVISKPVKYEMMSGNIGYIHIKNFETGAGSDTIAALDDLVKQGAKGVVFDVRENPGGFLSELLKALDHILPAGDIFVSKDENGNEKVETSDASCVKLPMVVMVNENTYSAAEFFAAALSEYNWAKIVGIHTTGKARSQINVELGDGSAVHLSTRSYLTPHRVDLAKQRGLAPDIETHMSQSDKTLLAGGALSHDKDVQLQAAIGTLKGKISK